METTQIVIDEERTYNTFHNISNKLSCSRAVFYVLITIVCLIIIVLSDIEHFKFDNIGKPSYYYHLIYVGVYCIFQYASYTLPYIVAFPHLNRWPLCVIPFLYTMVYELIFAYYNLPTNYSNYSHQVLKIVNFIMILIITPLIIWKMLRLSGLIHFRTFIYIITVIIYIAVHYVEADSNRSAFLRCLMNIGLMIIITSIFKFQTVDTKSGLFSVTLFNLFQDTFEEFAYIMHPVLIHSNTTFGVTPLLLLIIYNVSILIICLNASFILESISYSVYPFFFSVFTFYRIYLSVMIINTVPKQGLQLLFWCSIISTTDIIGFIMSIENVIEMMNNYIIRCFNEFISFGYELITPLQPLCVKDKASMCISDNVIVMLCHIYLLIVLCAKYIIIDESAIIKQKERIVNQLLYLLLSIGVLIFNTLYLKFRTRITNMHKIFDNLRYNFTCINFMMFISLTILTSMLCLND